jgi:hypothetical protein
MAQTGILDYKRYLNTLQTLTNLGQTFPSNQQTYNFAVAGGGTASWPATISWETLILDKVSYSSQATGYIPNVEDSQVIGYFEGSTATQYSSGVISIPANMYSGPILPGGDFHVPLTVVHLEWFDGVTTYAQQIGFIQNWEPGVEIGDPTEDFIFFPIYSIPSNLTLTGEAGIVFGDNLTLTATTDMAIDLGVNATRVRFFRVSTGTDVILGTSFFTGTVATLVLPTDPNLPIGTYDIYAVSQPRGIYRSATSNTLNVRVEAGVPLIVTTSTFTPNLAYYFPNHIVNYRLGVIADPAFTATGVAISNPVSIKLVNGFTPFTETNILNSNFVNGQASANFTVDSSMIDVARLYPETQYTITTSTQNSTRYTATLFVSNVETVTSNWGYQTLGRYRAGSTSTTINVATSTSVTVVGQPFPLTITQSSTSTYFDETFDITVGTNTATYYTNISLIANNGSTSTVLFSGNNSGSSSFTVSNILITTTGTWTITASYPGDLGQSLINANLPSTSNTLTHIVRLGNDLVPTPIVTLDRTPTNDIVKVSALNTITLVNTVTFLYNVMEIDTSSWSRMVLTTVQTTSSVKSGSAAAAGGGIERNFDSYRALNVGLKGYAGWSSSTASYDIFTAQPVQDFNRTWKWDSLTSAAGAPYIPWNAEPDVVVRVRNGVPIRFRQGFDYTSRRFTTQGLQIEFGTNINNQTADQFILNKNYFGVQKYSENVKTVNAFRLFKYYNGSNYNLSLVTGTNISEILDPITTGTTWTKDFVSTITSLAYTFNLPSVIRAPVNSAPAGTPAGAGSINRLFDYEQTGTVQVELFDIYKTDTIGTADGYNVVGLASDFYGNRTTAMTTSTPTRLYFKVQPYTSRVTGTRYNVSNAIDETNYLTQIYQNPVKTRYIDLVEYIGEVEWTKPIENAAQKAGTQSRSTIKVKLFKFTPTIPQANTEFKHNIGGGTEELTLPNPVTTSTYSDGTTIPNGGFRLVKFSTSLNRSQDVVKPTAFLPPTSPNTSPGPALNQAATGQYYTTFAWIDNWQDPTTGAVKNNTYKLSGYPATGVPGSISTLPYSTIEDQRYTDYGQKYWASTNPGNAEADNLAEFYNEWAMAFGLGQKGKTVPGTTGRNDTLMFFDPDFTTTTTYSFATDRQVARLDLPSGAIPDGDITTTLHAKWPGTLSLPLEYGRFNPFDIYASSTSTRPSLDYLVVGGGGAGGYNPAHGSGGGGAGAMVTGTQSIVFGEQIEIIIGQGGAPVGSVYGYSSTQSQTVSIINSIYTGAMSGKPSSFGSIVAVGGGFGGSNGIGQKTFGDNGGSGGGSGSGAVGNGVAGQGNAGGNATSYLDNIFGGGGGGAGAVGGNADSYFPPPPFLDPPYGYGGAGGAGKTWLDGVTYAGGGGGSTNFNGFPPGAGGVGGGGAGGSFGNLIGTSGTANTGGGGGGGVGGRNGGAGGSGVVIIRTLKNIIPVAYTINATITEVGDYRYYKWTSNGSVIF